jgi:Na+/glutamate symporter
MLFLTKIVIVWPLIIDQRFVNLTHISFLAIDHILGILVETISWSKICRC